MSSSRVHCCRSAVLLAAFALGGTVQAAPFLFVTNQLANNVEVVDTATGASAGTIAAGSGPFAIGIGPNGAYAYVANLASNDVSVIDTATRSVVATVGAGLTPYGVAVSPDNSRAYIANYGTNNVTVIDTSTNTSVASIAVGANPSGVAFNPSGTRAYVTNGGGNSVSVIDTGTNTVVDTIANVGISPWGIVVNPAGTRAYTANFSGGNVSVIDLGTDLVLTQIAIGHSPMGIDINPAGDRVYAVNRDDNTLSVIDATSNSVVVAVPIGLRPAGVAVHPNGKRAYTTNFNSHTSSVIDLATNTVIASLPAGSGPSSMGKFITAATTPAAPVDVAATPGKGTATLSFSPPPSDGGLDITGYVATCGGHTQSGLASPIVVSGLVNGVATTCTVHASNSKGAGTESAAVGVTPGAVPGAPTLQLIAHGDGYALVFFNEPADDGGLTIQHYTATCMAGTHTATGNASPLNVGGLTNDVTYSCSVVATNSAGDGPPSAPLDTTPRRAVDLSITVSNGTSFIPGGSSTSYLIDVSNNQWHDVPGAHVIDTLGPELSNASWICAGSGGATCPPSGTGGIDLMIDLPVNSKVSFLLTATVAALPEAPVSNSASVIQPAGFDDPFNTNNIATDGPDAVGIFRDGFQ